MQIFQTRWFARWAIKEGLTEHALINAVVEIEQGLVDAYLGNHIIKKRLAAGARGKSGGVRTILAFQIKDKAFFIYGYAKNQRDHINEKDLKALKAFASESEKGTD